VQGTIPFLMRRLLWVPLILFIVSASTFTLARLGPGDPISILQGQFRDPEVRERLRQERGLDKPIWDQYRIYMTRLLTKGDLGESYKYQGRKVREILFPAMWRSSSTTSLPWESSSESGSRLVFSLRESKGPGPTHS